MTFDSFTSVLSLKLNFDIKYMFSLIVCRRSLAKAKYCSQLQNVTTERSSAVQQLLSPIKKTRICASYSTKEPPNFGLQNQILTSYPYPLIEAIFGLDIESFRSSNFKQARYGDYEFTECLEGFVQIYVHGYHDFRVINAVAGYAIYFGENHPLNASGAVPEERLQNLKHSKFYGFRKTMDLIPKNLLPKICVCVDATALIRFVGNIQMHSENSFRDLRTGKQLENFETCVEIDTLLRLRQDIAKIRIKYVSNNIGNKGMRQAEKIATKAAAEATQLAKNKKYEK